MSSIFRTTSARTFCPSAKVCRNVSPFSSSGANRSVVRLGIFSAEFSTARNCSITSLIDCTCCVAVASVPDSASCSPVSKLARAVASARSFVVFGSSAVRTSERGTS